MNPFAALLSLGVCAVIAGVVSVVRYDRRHPLQTLPPGQWSEVTEAAFEYEEEEMLVG